MRESKIMFDLKNVSKYFKERNGSYLKAVRDVSLKIEEGSILGIVGESGSGKTTLGRCCMGMTPVNDGTILFNGKPINKQSKREKFDFNRQAQMIFQDPYASLDPQQKIFDILSEGIRIHRLFNGEHSIANRVYELLDLVGLDSSTACRYPNEFSGGQRQRIGIARALSVEPTFLFCDEPVSALDVTTQKQILDLLRLLNKDKGLTILFVSHDLAVVKSIADYVGVMYLGSLVELGPSEKVFQHPQHPYTKALLSAVPVPDPKYVRNKELIIYREDPSVQVMQNSSSFFENILGRSTITYEKNQMKEIEKDHFVII